MTMRLDSTEKMREVRSAYSYLSANDLRVFFGLGEKTRVDQITTYWPSGIKQTFNDIEANQLIQITEKI